MRKTLAAANRGERVPFKIPRSVQQSIPIQRVWQDGIWQVNGRFSQTWRFADINYSLASYEDQRDMFTSYCGVLNSLPTDAVTKITIHMFAHETNVDIDSRIIVFDLYEMGDQLKPTALNVTMETIQNRVATNRLAGKYTWVFVDEVYVRPEAA